MEKFEFYRGYNIDCYSWRGDIYICESRKDLIF